ncbi:MAG: hypothetical protein J6C19_07270 [Lachnospiraceae bacterium]|nr:hypothetical protein [Lachnospiraceae bacterium]
MKYEDLLKETAANDIYIIENANFKSRADGLINGDVIGINKNVRAYRKRTCILAEELGHYHTTVGNILDQSVTDNRKQEFRARIWAYNRLIGLNGIINSYRHGCQSLHDAAEFLEVTEEFLSESLQYYKSKYGICTTVDNYVIYFEPSLGVFELI